MECNLCEREFGLDRNPLCIACARASQYSSRVHQASGLLSREKVHTQVEAIARPGNDGVLAALPENADWDAITAGIRSQASHRAETDTAIAEARIREITAKADTLKQQIEGYKAIVTEQQHAIKKRQRDLASQRAKMEKTRSKALEPVLASVKRAGHRLDKVHTRTAEARGYLCKEICLLSGLRRVKDATGRSEYRLGGIVIPNLKELNGINGRFTYDSVRTSAGTKQLAEPHELLSAVFNSVCHLLGTCCHYLSVRPPAEIVMPHNDFPHAALLQRDASYRKPQLTFPGIATSRTTSPAASKHLAKDAQPKPRVLQLDRPLAQLQKEEPKSAARFVDGVMLLAYDIAWLNRTQGLNSIDKFDDVCDIGRNLYHLLGGKDFRPPTRPQINRNLSSATTRTDVSAAVATQSNPTFGIFSHGSRHHNLSSHEGIVLFEGWKVSLAKFTDQLSAHLRNETARAEWHFVDDTEWDEEMDEERAVLVGGAGKRRDTSMSVMTVAGMNENGDKGDAETGEIGKERRGWTKIRDRGSGGNETERG